MITIKKGIAAFSKCKCEKKSTARNLQTQILSISRFPYKVDALSCNKKSLHFIHI